MIDLELQGGAHLQRALLHWAQMHEEVAGLLLGVGDAELDALARQQAGVADLAAGLRIERRLVEHDRTALAGLQAVGILAVLHQRRHHAFGALGLVAEEFGGAELFAQRKPDVLARGIAGARPRRARLGLLLFHRVGERRLVDADAARLQRVLRQVEREAIGVVQRERGIAVEHVALLQASALLVEDRQAALQRLAEARLFQPQRFLDQLFGAHQFRIGLAHLAHQRPHQAMHQRLARAEQLRMAHGAAHDPAQHIAATLVRRQHAVGNQERRCAQVVRDHAQRGLLLALRVGAGQLRDRADQGYEQVDVVIVMLALQDGRDALQPGAGVDRGLWQRIAHAALELLELHEHEIPDFDEAVAVLLGGTRRAAPDLVAVIVEDFRARTAGAGVAHLPEIVGTGDADDAQLRQACDLLPEIERLVVVDIDGRRQLVLRQAELLRDEFPGEFDRAILEVVAEREIAEHLEKSVMPRGVADIVEVVVLAAGAHAFLRSGGALVGALLDTGEDVLELHHAGIGEHQGRVVARHERRRRHDLVAVLRKEIQEFRPDLVDAAHVHPIGNMPGSGRK